jgi:5'-3' exonuclease
MAPGSPIADFYPTDFECDLNGKKYTWQAVVLLPWIDEQRLLASIAPLEAALSGRDKIRNSIGCVQSVVIPGFSLSAGLTFLH